MNTGFLGPTVATVPTVYGIETVWASRIFNVPFLLQQYLPFTVLKHFGLTKTSCQPFVATVPTVYGIETVW